MASSYSYDVLVIGSGAAGLSLALRLPRTTRVAVVAKRALTEGNTFYAQGGISAVLDAKDSLDAHFADTIKAGGGLCDPEAVRLVVDQGPGCIHWLVEQGVQFTPAKRSGKSSGYHLTREGGHSHRRVIHAGDATGLALQTALDAAVRDRDNIERFEHHIAVDLIAERRRGAESRCVGAYVLDKASGKVRTFRARFVVLATGGASKAYLYTTNPDVATGDGIAIAWRAGCRVANMEFMQFHPTCLYHPKAKSFLISEAVRGEGGQLLLPNGKRFMPDFDERAELAPRDVVARAIDHEIKRLGAECVYLDISHRPADFVREHFPTIHTRCLEYGIDITKEPIPVVPAAHYTCGGVVVAIDSARTDIANLYAIGEVAYTGLHGANRMASNSLLECVVFAAQAARDIEHRLPDTPEPKHLPAWDESRVTDADELVVVTHNWDELRRFMWDYVGIVRTNKRLERAKRRVDLLRREIVEFYSRFKVNNDLLELRNLVEVADLIISSAQRRKESRGLHYTEDFPLPDERQRQPTILIPDSYAPRTERP